MLAHELTNDQISAQPIHERENISFHSLAEGYTPQHKKQI
jgi:hypothetical protein